MKIRGIVLSAIGARGRPRAGPALLSGAPWRRAASAAAWIVVAALAAGPARAVTLTRHPWISLVTPTSVLIAWQTDTAADGTVYYGASPQSLTGVQSHPGTAVNHSVSVSGLGPITTYYYYVLSGGVASPVYTFRTAPDPATAPPFRFVAFGDIGRATPEQIAIAGRVDLLNPDLAILTGDIIYEAGEAANFTPQYFDIYRPTIARTPFYPSLGNHDIGTLNGQPYLDAYYLPSNNPAVTERYYSFDYGNAHFVSIECSVQGSAPSASMLSWLDSDLAATTRFWKFVFYHIPIYSNPGTHGSDLVIRAALEPILNARGVDIVFQGHNHYYTRTYPIQAGAVVSAAQEPDYVNPGGTIYVVTGGGGRVLYAVTALQPFEAYSKSTFHVTTVDVFGNSLLLEAVERDGTVIDAMTLVKDTPTAVTLAAFAAQSDPEGVRLRWSVPVGSDAVGFHVYRGSGPASVSQRLTSAPVVGGPDFEFIDRSAEADRSYWYGLGAIDRDGHEERTGLVEGSRGGVPRFSFGRAHPNPSAGETAIPLSLDRASGVRVVILDVHGRMVRVLEDAVLGAGPHTMRWDGRDGAGRPAASGLYFAKAEAGARLAIARVVLLR